MVLTGVEGIFQFNEDFMKSYNEDRDEGYLFLPKRMKIEKIEKLVANSHNKKEYIIHIRNLK